MEFDLGWILLGMPLAFGLGWMASRLDLRQLRLAVPLLRSASPWSFAVSVLAHLREKFLV